MSFVVARMQKLKADNLIGLGNHDQRKTANHSNQDIDVSRSHFNDLHILKPDYTMINKTSERHTVMALLFDESEWGKLNRNTKYKFKKIFKEISPIDLTDLMKQTLKAKEKQLQKQIDFWQREFRFWK